MIVAPAVKGWCPGAYRPMMSGDGLIVRVRPRLARLTRMQMIRVCDLSAENGNGVLQVTNRANVQIRGIREADHPYILDALADVDLLDVDPVLEARRNVVPTPLWTPGDLTCRLTSRLLDRLSDLPVLPDKFGYAIDAGPQPRLHGVSADIRFESGPAGEPVLRADGADFGRVVTEDSAIDALVELAEWFAGSAARCGARRMSQLIAKEPPPAAWRNVAGSFAIEPPPPGDTPIGPLVGLPFGQADARSLSAALGETGATAVRITPWRLVLLEGGGTPTGDGFILDPRSPLLKVDACPGAPFCPGASVETRSIARELAPHATGTLHISGCSKGCARNRAAQATFVGRDGRFDLVEDGCAWDEPVRRDLLPTDLAAACG